MNRRYFQTKKEFDQSHQREIWLDSYSMVLQAAEASQRVALGWGYDTDPMVAGQLVRPTGPEVIAFVNWPKHEAEAGAQPRMSRWNAKPPVS